MPDRLPDSEPPVGTRADREPTVGTTSGQPGIAPGSTITTEDPEHGAPPSDNRAVEREFTIKARSQSSLILRRFLAHRLAVASLVVFIGLILVSLVGGRLWKYQYGVPTMDYSQPPSLDHPMGTDGIGRDTLAEVLRGAQKSVQIALLVAVLSTLIGTLVGAIAGYYRGLTDTLLMRTVDLVLTIPAIALTAVVAANVGGGGGGWLLIALILSLLLWAPISRQVRGQFLSLREKEFVEAARALGASDARIIFRHLLPNALGPIIVYATIIVAVAILLETALSFLGVGVKAPDTSLGLLVAQGQQAAQTRPWLFYFPGIVIVIIALTINFVGDGLRDAFDPTQTRVRA